MAASPPAAAPDSEDQALDRLEAALDSIAHGLQTPRRVPPAAEALATGPDLQPVEQRLDTLIDYVKSTLGRKIDS